MEHLTTSQNCKEEVDHNIVGHVKVRMQHGSIAPVASNLCAIPEIVGKLVIDVCIKILFSAQDALISAETAGPGFVNLANANAIY